MPELTPSKLKLSILDDVVPALGNMFVEVAVSFSAFVFIMTQDVCAVGASAGVQTFGVGISGGKHFIDKNCERLKLSRILNDFGMKVAAVAILCQDERVFESMIQAGTPCPIDGKIGKDALALWSKYDHERPDYKTYVKRMKKREKIEAEIQKIKIEKLEPIDVGKN